MDVARSARDPARAPCHAPISIPPTRLTVSAQPISISDRGSASASTAATDRCSARDHPRSPRKSDWSHRQYWVAMESSNPYCARIVARSSGDSPSPSAVAGSPGARWSRRKAMVAAATITAAPCAAQERPTEHGDQGGVPRPMRSRSMRRAGSTRQSARPAYQASARSGVVTKRWLMAAIVRCSYNQIAGASSWIC